jgi:hypothetical protein
MRMVLDRVAAPSTARGRGRFSVKVLGWVTPVKAEFIAAAVAEQEYTGGSVEICAVLNRLPSGFLSGPDDQVIDAVDVLMDDLYRHGGCRTAR